MNTALENLEPKSLWKHFAALSAIPRGSGNEAGARNYVLQQAASLGLEATVDPIGNVVVRKPARPGHEGAVPAALQSHLDMVCEKNEGTPHNFETDPIHIVRDGDWIKANGTTLGADNGVGVATCLAVMEDQTVAHGPLEFVFTIDEETGLTGAVKFPNGALRAKYFLNLDGEEEGTLCIGCAGGINTIARHSLSMETAPTGAAWRLKISGLAGGHSGVDIHKGRGNAVRALGRVLAALMDAFPVAVAEMKGGSKRNAIPREAYAIVTLDAARENELRSLVKTVEAEIQSELGAFDPALAITIDAAPRPDKVISAADARLAVSLLLSLPHGVLAMSPAIPGLVQTSTNLATVSTADGQLLIETSQRSSIESSKQATERMVAGIFRLAGCEIEHSGEYPGWKPEPTSDVVRKAEAVHQEILGAKPELVAMHAGLECGVIGEKHPGMQMVSFGPHIIDVHSPSERLKISSVQPFWKFLTGLLERI
jgi:dipeptidase D